MPELTSGNLKAWGPVIEVAVGPSVHRARALERAGRSPVFPFLVKALIDTGTATTCVDLGVINELDLTAKGDALIATPTTGSHSVTVATFDIQLQWIGPPHVTASPALRVWTMDLSHLGIRVLLGRDVLSHCHLIYDGPSDQFTFSF